MMSSSSNRPALAPDTTEQPPSEADKLWLAQLLDALAKEVAHLGTEITGVGEALSTHVFARGEMQGVKEMQAFDALSQLARAQADLLTRISAQLGEPADEMKSTLHAAIANLPIFDVRQRMLQVVDPVAAGESDQPEDDSADAIQWFE